MMSLIEQRVMLLIKRKLSRGAERAEGEGIKLNEFLYAAKVKLFNVLRQLDFEDIFESEVTAMQEELEEENRQKAKEWKFRFWGECGHCKHMLDASSCNQNGRKHACFDCGICGLPIQHTC